MIDSHPADFTQWLSGNGPATDPPGWAWRRTPSGIVLGPSHGRGIAILSTVAGLFAAGLVFLIGMCRRGIVVGAVGGTVVAAIGFGLLATVVLLTALAALLVRDQRAGPYLVCRTGDRTFELPRARLTLPATDVIGWRIVTGNWVGSLNVQTRQGSARSELHLIADTPNGRTAYLICAWVRTPLADSLREFAAATGLSLETVNQPDVEYGASSARLRDTG